MNTDDLAGGQTLLGSTAPEELLAGEAKLVTDWAPVTTGEGVTFSKFEVFALNSAGSVVKYNPAASDTTATPVGILAQPIAAETTTKVPYFVGGFFNHAALVWPASLTTLAARKEVFLRTPIEIGELSN